MTRCVRLEVAPVAALLCFVLVSTCHPASVPRVLPAAQSGRVGASISAVETAATATDQAAAIEGLVEELQSAVPLRDWTGAVCVDGYTVCFVREGRNGISVWQRGFFDQLVPARSIKTDNCRRRVVTAGAGTAYVGIRHRRDGNGPPESRFFPPAGLACAVTLLLDFAPAADTGARRELRVTLADPEASKLSLAADYTAPLSWIAHTRKSAGRMTTLGLFRPGCSDARSGFCIMGPYRRGKIPVVFVHGLDSSPLTWLEVYNELRADPFVRERYQFWFFVYPTGYPVPFSAATLRASLQDMRASIDPRARDAALQRTLIVGHSMGGLVSRMMLADSGDIFWRPRFDRPPSELPLPDEDRRRIDKALVFDRQDYIARAVFIATPHGGAPLARGKLRAVASKLIDMPEEIDGMTKRMISLGSMVAGSPAVKKGKLPTGVDTLSPNSVFIGSLRQLPIEVPFHSIIANRGVTCPDGNDTDGLVPRWSSHLDGAQSELTVPARHNAHENPAAIAELGRILRLHASR